MTAPGWLRVVELTIVLIICMVGVGFAQNLTPSVQPVRSSGNPTSTDASAVLPINRSAKERYGLPGTLPHPTSAYAVSTLPRVFAPTRPRTTYTRYPWKRQIVTTVFWIGEEPTPKNPTPNHMSAWDRNWKTNFGGFDNPDPSARAWDFRPKAFVPGLNPFYIALPYTDIRSGATGTKAEAPHVIPWFKKTYQRAAHTVLKGRWLAIRKGSRVCFAQWEDVGPFVTNDYQYVFGNKRPKTNGNGGAGLDVSPAVRDFLMMRSGERCDWRFVDVSEVPQGPWRKYGVNNDFTELHEKRKSQETEHMAKLREMREAYIRNMPRPR
ncbi:MAG: hypothetical protein GXP30_04375 [Verrucomicrobia bacterium]|nr:hypothetical protein [Verrucomicrobiota bacterium]